MRKKGQTMGAASKQYLNSTDTHYDWKNISYLLLLSRAIDTIEERDLVPAKLVFNQFSARGHDLAQILLGSMLTHPRPRYRRGGGRPNGQVGRLQ